MQVIEITSLSGHSPYNISICDITRTYCYVVATAVSSVPLILNIPTELSGSQEVLVIVTDNIGCEEIQYHFCGEPAPSQTPTTTPTPTPTNSVCNCISIDNPLGVTLNFGYTQCDGTLIYGEIYSATTLYVCGQFPYGDSGLVINISSNICVGNVCPGPTPTPTTTPTPTPTLPPIVGYFEDSCDSSNQFTLSNIPISFSPLSGAYYIESSGFIGCATYVVSSSTNNFYSFISMGSQPSIYHCQKANFIYPCPTSTPTPTPTPSITPSVTPTHTPTPTPTNTPTPTTPVKYVLFQVQSCCSKKIIKYIMLPSNFLPGTAVVNSFGECLEIISVSKTQNWVTDFWDHGTTYIFCEVCVKYRTCNPVTPPSFISVWRTTTINESITLPYETSGFYYGTIDWGDGETSNNIYDNRTHTYATPGDYTITVTGTLIGWSFGVNPISRNKIREVLQWGCLRLGNSSSYFSYCDNLSLSNVTDVLDLTGTNNLSYTFENCYNLTTVPFINSWNTSNVTNMQGMFFECHSFNDDISGWDVSNVTEMGAMFDNTYLFNQPIGVWDVSNVQSISYMFLQNTVFNQNLSSWNVGNVTNMKGTFNGCTSFNNGGSPMISGWTTYNVTDMGDMFPLTPFNQPINSWDVSSVTKMDYMFSQSTSFNQPLSGWNVSNVTDMNYMFSLSPFNQYINSWDVSNVTTMEGMFFFNTIFNQNLNSWDVSSVTNMDYMFWFDYAFDGNITSWDTSNVTTMRLMFATCTIFNQNISGWNVGNVTNMQQMFNGATQFNQPIGSWNVSNVTNMSNMFGSVGFNQNIGSWNVTGVTNFIGFMNGKTFSDYSTTNLDAIYNGWSSLPTLTYGININFGTIKYTAGSSAGRAILTGTYGWTIIDGGI